MRASLALILFLGACAPASKPAPVMAPMKHSVAHARVSATAPAESDARSSSKERAILQHASRARATAAELFGEWAKAAPPLAIDAHVITHAEGDALDLTVTAATPERALFACREVLAGLEADEEHDRQEALTALRVERARVVARLADVTHLLHGFEIRTNDFASAHADAAEKLANAKAAGRDFPGALGAIAEALERATKEQAVLAASYGPNHPARLANGAEIAVLTLQKEAQKKLEVDAAQAELDGIDALAKNKKSPTEIPKLRRSLLVSRLSSKSVTPAAGVDVEAPATLRDLALEHLRLRVERARDSVSYGDAHPKMIATNGRLSAIESEFEWVRAKVVVAMSVTSLPVSDGALRGELEHLIDRLVQILAWEDATVKQKARLVVVSPCAG